MQQLSATKNYMPVALLHGIFSNAQAMKPIKDTLEKQFPGIYVHIIKYGNSEIIASVTSPKYQLELIHKNIMSNVILKNNKFILIGHSQGGLLARCWMQKYCNPQNPWVHTLISLGAPQNGFYGIPTDFDENITKYWESSRESSAARVFYTVLKECLEVDRDNAYKKFYNKTFQSTISFANYWKDPVHYDDYCKNCKFLSKFNNETDHDHAADYKENINTLENFVLVKSYNDEIIEPQESCHMLFYKQGSNAEHDIEKDFTQTAQYTKNLLGLKTLYDSQRLHFKEVACRHTEFQTDAAVASIIAGYIRVAQTRVHDENYNDQIPPKISCCTLV